MLQGIPEFPSHFFSSQDSLDLLNSVNQRFSSVSFLNVLAQINSTIFQKLEKVLQMKSTYNSKIFQVDDLSQGSGFTRFWRVNSESGGTTSASGASLVKPGPQQEQVLRVGGECHAATAKAKRIGGLGRIPRR